MLNGGGINQLQTIVHEVNQTFNGNQPRIRALLGSINAAVTSLAGGRSSVDNALAAIGNLSQRLNAGSSVVTASIGTLAPAVGSFRPATSARRLSKRRPARRAHPPVPPASPPCCRTGSDEARPAGPDDRPARGGRPRRLLRGGGILQVKTGRQPYVVTLDMPRAGGIYAQAAVTYNGVTVGKVSAIHPGLDGVEATSAPTAGTHIPANSSAHIRQLSALGEQYVDLVPAGPGGPMMRAGRSSPPTVRRYR